ncbi:unnamed protein product [Cuscuta epithymum]|uniref:DUF7138 domain-containing protein n=1 Tax=Cuscuta epithymum TaxID=186058 RepID=A0AAV0C6X0_9ASTE|nr:unnamed protein product [Cuscuta epithymum]
MVENVGGPGFPVLFFDGEQEINIGTIRIHPMMDFKAFQFILSKRIGISPNQISIYLCDTKADRKRIPITGKVNFAFIAREKDCFFLAVLKRSRKARNRKAKMNWMADYRDYLTEIELAPPPRPENLILLRRNQPELSVAMDPGFPEYEPPYHDQISQAELAGLNHRLHSLKIQRENYAMAMARSNPDPVGAVNPNPKSGLDPDAFPSIQDSYSTMTKKEKSSCKECRSTKNGKTAGFHPCVNDPVIPGKFRSRAGPIRRSPGTPR